MSDAFALKIDAAGMGLVYSTFIGGSEPDGALACALDAEGSLFVSDRWQPAAVS